MRRVVVVLGGFWLLTAVVPVWLIAGAFVISATGVVLESKPTPWTAGAVLVALDLAWATATVGAILLVVRRRRRAQESRSSAA